MRLAGHVARMWKMKNGYIYFIGKVEGKRSLERHWRRWEDNMRMGLREVRWEGADWIYLAQDRHHRWDLVNAVINVLFQKKTWNLFTRWVTISFSRKIPLQGVNYLIMNIQWILSHVKFPVIFFTVFMSGKFNACTSP